MTYAYYSPLGQWYNPEVLYIAVAVYSYYATVPDDH
jgi:hypothetical protein